jgi:cellobiose phosphorylase
MATPLGDTTGLSCHQPKTTGRTSSKSNPTSTARARTRSSRKKFGRSRIPWLSGTASWAHFTATNFLLGIRPEPSGLRIDPVIPRDWPGFTATRKFRGANIHIEIKNPGGKNRGITQLTVNGTRVEGNLAPVGLLKPETTIEAVL